MTAEWITALAAVASTVIVTMAAVAGLVQLREMTKQRRLEVFMHLADQISGDDARGVRQQVYDRVAYAPMPPTSDDLFVADAALSSLDRLWILTHEKMLDRDTVLQYYGEMICRLWIALRPLVEFERTRRGPWYRRRAELLAAEANDYLVSRGQPVFHPYRQQDQGLVEPPRGAATD